MAPGLNGLADALIVDFLTTVGAGVLLVEEFVAVVAAAAAVVVVEVDVVAAESNTAGGRGVGSAAPDSPLRDGEVVSVF